MKQNRLTGLIGIGLLFLGCVLPFFFVSGLGIQKSNYFLMTIDSWIILLFIPSVINVVIPNLINRTIAGSIGVVGIFIYLYRFTTLASNTLIVTYEPQVGSYMLMGGFILLIMTWMVTMILSIRVYFRQQEVLMHVLSTKMWMALLR